MGSMSIVHWLIVLTIVLLLFGGGKLGELGKGMGEGIKNFKKGLADDDGTEAAALKKRIAELEAKNKEAPKDG
jgi:sec-independent protein translocase protein TatA